MHRLAMNSSLSRDTPAESGASRSVRTASAWPVVLGTGRWSCGMPRLASVSDELASSAVGGTVKVWDAHTGQELLTLKGQTHQIRSVVFSPDGKRLASGSKDGTVKLWDAHTGQETLTLKGSQAVFSPDG